MERQQLETGSQTSNCQPGDLKLLWDHWDESRQEQSPRQYVKGWNLTALILLLAGASCQVWGAGIAKLLSPYLIIGGAVILGVKKARSLWRRRSLSR